MTRQIIPPYLLEAVSSISIINGHHPVERIPDEDDEEGQMSHVVVCKNCNNWLISHAWGNLEITGIPRLICDKYIDPRCFDKPGAAQAWDNETLEQLNLKLLIRWNVGAVRVMVGKQ